MSNILRNPPTIELSDLVTKQFEPFFGNSVPQTLVEGVCGDLASHLTDILHEHATGQLSDQACVTQIVATVSHHLPSFSEDHLTALLQQYVPAHQVPVHLQHVLTDIETDLTQLQHNPTVTPPTTSMPAPVVGQHPVVASSTPIKDQHAESQSVPGKPGLLAQIKKYIK